mgnify:CR=1 FL=1|jgi:hypothetical protein
MEDWGYCFILEPSKVRNARKGLGCYFILGITNLASSYARGGCYKIMGALKFFNNMIVKPCPTLLRRVSSGFSADAGSAIELVWYFYQEHVNRLVARKRASYWLFDFKSSFFKGSWRYASNPSVISTN